MTDSSNEAQQKPQFSQNKKGFIEAEGEITELFPAGSFKVVLDNGHELLAHLSGKMRMYKIRLVAGDRVRVEMSPYDLEKGRITFRL
ncbi:MAG: translation initiation factor IF-1 [Patescibacteria group bacterium]